MLAGTPPFHSDDDIELMKKVKKASEPHQSYTHTHQQSRIGAAKRRNRRLRKWEFKPEKAWRRVSASGKEPKAQVFSVHI